MPTANQLAFTTARHADNRAHQADRWLDFQWCQTGHHGEHVPERVADMWRKRTTQSGSQWRANLRERGCNRAGPLGGGKAHEAWCNLCAGGTMGVVYGAGKPVAVAASCQRTLGTPSIFWPTAAGWREALDFAGAGYVGLLAPHPRWSTANRYGT